uniref:Uncharacterized protein n=1 Tax=Utricularia reniformis TaxID=192314 RepID=A0A1Y0AZ07_9LAMI|nr:hypothetical protein AEK19_MT1762 [Utricularia reniformis]ART30406.1 hypothetical protein AEK19_MT1762 [Utricularia reniformis]
MVGAFSFSFVVGPLEPLVLKPSIRFSSMVRGEGMASLSPLVYSLSPYCGSL